MAVKSPSNTLTFELGELQAASQDREPYPFRKRSSSNIQDDKRPEPKELRKLAEMCGNKNGSKEKNL